MKRLITTTLAVALLLGLAALAVLARGGGETLVPVRTGSAVAAPVAFQGAAAPAAPAAPSVTTQKYNMIALPLDASGVISPFKASGLAAYQPGTKQVLKWNASSQPQKWDSYTPGGPAFTNFDLVVGGSYFLLVDNTAGNVFSIVGNVPEQGSVKFTLVPGSSTVCKYNSISIPLNRSDITKASQLATAIGGVKQVLAWDAASTPQKFKSYIPGGPSFTDFSVSIGYPYLVCLNDLAPTQWP